MLTQQVFRWVSGRMAGLVVSTCLSEVSLRLPKFFFPSAPPAGQG